MAKFLGDLVVTKVTEAGAFSPSTWRLEKSFGFQRDIKTPHAPAQKIIVPEGFETDFASVPRLPLMFWLNGDTAQKSAVIHDYAVGVFSWPEAADILNEAMICEGVPSWRRVAMVAAVRMRGWVKPWI